MQVERILKNFKVRLGPLWWHTAIMFGVHRFVDVINVFIGLWLVPRYVSADELGAVLPLGQIGALLGLPLAIVLMPFTKFLSAFGTKEEFGKVKALLLHALLITALSGLAIALYTWFSAPFFFERLRIGSTALVWILCGIAVTSAFLPVLNNALQALKHFDAMRQVGLTATPVRLGVLWLLLPCCGLTGFFGAQFFYNATIIGISLWSFRGVLSRTVTVESYWHHRQEILRYTVPVGILMAANTVLTSVQLLVIRQRLTDVESAAYYFCSRFAEMPSIVWAAIAVAFFPVISEAFEKGDATRRTLVQALSMTVGGGMAIAAVLGLSMKWLFGAVASWHDYRPYAHLVWWLAVINVFRVAAACFSTHEMACRRFRFIYYFLPIAILEMVVLVAFTGYGFFAPYFPSAWVEWMASVRAARLEFIVGVMFISSGAIFLGLVAQTAAGGRWRLAT